MENGVYYKIVAVKDGNTFESEPRNIGKLVPMMLELIMQNTLCTEEELLKRLRGE